MVTKSGPRTYTPVEDVQGGQVLEARAGGVVGVAAAGSVKVVGVGLTDAQPPASLKTGPVNGVLNASPLPTTVAVAYGGIETLVVYAGAATFGDRLVAAAAGKVDVADADTDPRAVIGICTAPAGVSPGKTGLARIN